MGANLSNTKLHQTGFWNSNLSKANFSSAIMDETSLDGSNLCHANLMGARPDPEYDDSNTINGSPA
ncbi:pentapeptide repeat-containing protein [Microcoleus sp. CZ3-B2]|uniref:pentapeptide repeat-containing protein n=1 Tax=unclassified Microcoleus TaxID=2642155 RepID=UPI003FA5BF57